VTAVQARQVLRANAVFDFAAGLLLLVRDLRRALERARPAPGSAGATCAGRRCDPGGLAHVLLQAADHAPLRGPRRERRRGCGRTGRPDRSRLAARGLPEDVDTLGTTLLIALLVVLGGFAMLQARTVRTPEPGSSRVC
jgi:hypothetical protein